MKVGIVHDWLLVYGGAERVLKELLVLFPDAHLYSTVCFVPDEQRAFLGRRAVTTTFIQRLQVVAVGCAFVLGAVWLRRSLPREVKGAAPAYDMRVWTICVRFAFAQAPARRQPQASPSRPRLSRGRHASTTVASTI